MYMITYQTIASIMAVLVLQYVSFVVWHGAPTAKWRVAGFLLTIASWVFLAYLILSVPHV